MFDDLVESAIDVAERLAPVVAGLDVETLSPEDAAELVGLFVRVEQMAAAGRVLATRAVGKGEDVWRRAGFRSAAAWMAFQAGLPVGSAIASVEMAGLLDGLPAVDAAFRAGKLSELQAREICDAASEDPDAEQLLLDMAGKTSLRELREECRRVKAAAVLDEEEQRRRVKKGRYLRCWSPREGGVRISAWLTTEEAGMILAPVDSRCDEIVRKARAGGWFESPEAHRADALVDVVRSAGVAGKGSGPGPKATMMVWVDYDALVRGHTVPGEKCEVPGLGPIPVSVARRLAGDCFLNLLVTKGVDISVVARGGRVKIPAHMVTGLEGRDPTCIVPGCDMRRGLQIDHHIPEAADGLTEMKNLARLCPYHHYMKSKHGHNYRGSPGDWHWYAPEIPTEPPLYPP